MSALDKIKAQGGRGGDRLEVTVPEWDDLKIFYRKSNLNDLAEVIRAAPGNVVRQNVEMFVLLAQEADGKPMFKRIDVLELMEKADPEVLVRVFGEMGILAQRPEDVEKN